MRDTDRIEAHTRHMVIDMQSGHVVCVVRQDGSVEPRGRHVVMTSEQAQCLIVQAEVTRALALRLRQAGGER